MKQAIKQEEVLEISFSKGEAKDFIEIFKKIESQRLWKMGVYLDFDYIQRVK